MTDLEKSIGDMVRRIVREELATVTAKPPQAAQAHPAAVTNLGRTKLTSSSP